MTGDRFDRIFSRAPIMAILRGYSPQRTVELATLAWEVGVDAVEVPIQSPLAVEALRACVDAGARQGRLVGAGTVVSVEHVATAADAGAVFTVAPGLDLEVAEASVAAGLSHLPGVGTATEVQRAMGAGLRWVKAFPADALGTAWVRGIRGPFPDVRIVATGGISSRNAADFLAAGADVVAVGSALEDESQLHLLADLIRAH
ncbi:bifunctional 4-hydroxy-2-oxoglutarate aldolase/2-dehydro-3-deoxy-phosphogluconate aldolase [Microbacterium sp. NIBRBAC000506063]|uniref:bifunctional 4-hydroxy-2-oxoglutarate aldolase/2-dehydro-3-deoxy-phosphogluconate aldolase n=1 Tax=Microbacterium sp. NIBRBAC000506063 TaxID=2734618 RepID=UPI001CB6BF99|nr:bifunctional 4-hydroxy-2-oxoglutarate aldolase/2-dehydro-3-deoxy-phosphogluconate aldolase [Microbacterium sp. NIBRBAC000506063]